MTGNMFAVICMPILLHIRKSKAFHCLVFLAIFLTFVSSIHWSSSCS